MLGSDWSVQNIVYITATDMWLLGKVLIIDCNTRYEGCNDYYRQQLGNMYLQLCLICYYYLSSRQSVSNWESIRSNLHGTRIQILSNLEAQ